MLSQATLIEGEHTLKAFRGSFDEALITAKIGSSEGIGSWHLAGFGWLGRANFFNEKSVKQ